MKRRTIAIVGAVGALVAVGAALATPGSGLAPVAHVPRATLAEPVHVNADRIKFQTKQATDVSVVSVTVAPGGTTGWHSHPGLAIIAITQGTLTLYGPDCRSETFSAGDVFVESGDDPPAVARNETGANAVFTVTFVAPKGVPFRIDHPNPGCAVQ